MNERLVTVARWSSSPMRSTERRVERDLLVGLAQRGVPEVRVAVVLAPAREAHLARVRPQLPRAAGEHDVQLAVVLVQRRQHGRRRGRSPAGAPARTACAGRRRPAPPARRPASAAERSADRSAHGAGPPGAGVQRAGDDLVAAPTSGHGRGGRREVLARPGPAGHALAGGLPGRQERRIEPVDRIGDRLLEAGRLPGIRRWHWRPAPPRATRAGPACRGSSGC